jgi:hypothetical protein
VCRVHLVLVAHLCGPLVWVCSEKLVGVGVVLSRFGALSAANVHDGERLLQAAPKARTAERTCNQRAAVLQHLNVNLPDMLSGSVVGRVRGSRAAAPFKLPTRLLPCIALLTLGFGRGDGCGDNCRSSSTSWHCTTSSCRRCLPRAPSPSLA